MPSRRQHNTLLCRSAILNGFSESVIELGHVPATFMHRHNLPVAALSEQDLMLPVRQVLALFNETANALDVEDLGIRIAEARPFSTMGPITLAMRERTSIGDALASLADNIHIQAEGVSLLLNEEGNLLFVSPVIDAEVGGPTRQPIELMLATLTSLLRQFLGPRWRPHTVMFMHKAPATTARHRSVFGSEPLFNCDRNALVLQASDLSRPIANSDPVFAQQLQQYLSSMDRTSGADIASQTRELIAQLLPKGQATADAVAACLGTTRRTLHRRLTAQDTSYRELLQQVRREQFQSLVKAGNLQQQEIADKLGFLSASAFSRWKRAL